MPLSTPANRPTVIFCCCQRTGSTMVVDDFQNVLGRPPSESEALWRFVLKPEDGPRNWEQAIALLEDYRKDEPVFYDKVMSFYLPQLSRMIDPAGHTPSSKPFADYFSGATWVYIRRANVFEQAVSKYIAEELGVWHYQHVQEDDFNARMAFDLELAKDYVRSLIGQDQEWVRFFREHKIKPLEIYYEDAVANFPCYLDPLLKAIGMEVDPDGVPKRRMKKVGNERNKRLSEILREMYLRDLIFNQTNMRQFFRHRFI